MAGKRSRKAPAKKTGAKVMPGGRKRPGRVSAPPVGERSARRNGAPKAVHRAGRAAERTGRAAERAGRAALERAGRGRNPVVRKRPGGRRNGKAPPLTVRGIGLLARGGCCSGWGLG
jgi:hypothetical protein